MNMNLKQYARTLWRVLTGKADTKEPEAFTVLSKEMALKFVPALSRRYTSPNEFEIVSLDDLQLRINTIPMLAALSIEDEEVVQAAYKANPALNIPF